MPAVLVRYRVKPDAGDVNHALVAKVFDELAATDPGGVRYMTLRLDDGVTFHHIAVVEADPNPLSETAAFKEFQRELGDRCDEPPVVTPVDMVGQYRFQG